jgi:4'-phosphopantetheinyl transferase
MKRGVERLERLSEMLSPEERARADRFHFRRDRDRFVVRHGMLRSILGAYLHLDPRDLRFSLNQHGKPALTDTGGGLSFSLSHSNALAVYAIGPGPRLGVDVELLRPMPAQRDVAECFFSSREVAALRSLPAPLQSVAFFTCWTRKEAYVKATGEGLTCPLDQFDVSLAPDEPAALLTTARRRGPWLARPLRGVP